LVGKTITAIYGAIISGLEWDFAFFAAGSANSVKHLALSSAIAAILAHIAAGLAPLRFIGKTSFLKKILFTCRECKFLSAIFANNCFVLMDQLAYLFKIKLYFTYV